MRKIEKKTDLFDKTSRLIEQSRRKVATTINQEKPDKSGNYITAFVVAQFIEHIFIISYRKFPN